jgi:septal ring factor EnvC (AmiA/AmiB activator)
MPPHSSLELAITRHDAEIEKVKDNYHQLDLNVLDLKKDVKAVLDKLDAIVDNNNALESELKKQDEELERLIKEQEESLSGRITKLETIHNNREWWLNAVLKVLKLIAKLWWAWIILAICIFAFDLQIKVENPALVTFITDLIKNKL